MGPLFGASHMGFEYIIFDEELVQRFVRFAADLGVAGQVQAEPLGGWVVQISEDLPEAAELAIEAEYNRLMLRQRDLLDAADGADAHDVLGVALTLPDGRSCWVRVPAHLGRRLAEHFNFEEIHQLVALVAEQALHPADGPVCRKPQG